MQKNKNVSIFILFQKNVFIRAETRIVYVWFILWESEAPVISMECEQDVMRLPLFGLFSHPQLYQGYWVRILLYHPDHS